MAWSVRRGRALACQLVLVLVLAGVAGGACAPSPPPRHEASAATPPAPSTTPTIDAAPPDATSDPIATPPPALPAVPDVTVAAVGDLMLARRIEGLMAVHGPGYPFGRVRDLLRADLAIGNLEGTLTDRGTPLAKQYTFRTDPRHAAALVEARFSAVSVANNHATDFGAVSLEDTLASLRDSGLPTFGGGPTLEAASTPVVLRTAEGARVALLAFDDIGEVLFATSSSPGVAPLDTDLVRGAVEAARAQADYVVVFVHWGAEYSRTVTPRQEAGASAAIEAGADLVLGAHPHVLQRAERIGDGLVLYSLGNFVFDLDHDDMATLGEAPFQSTVARVTLSRSAPPRVEFVPVRIDPDENRPRPATPEEAAPILDVLGQP